MLLVFFILAYAWAWAFWTISVTVFSGQNTPPGLFLMILGGFGPSLAGLLLTYAGQRNPSPDPLWSRAFDPRRLPVRAAFASIVTPLLLIAATLALVAVFGRSALARIDLGAFALVTTLMFGPLSEELGWRGYALEPLQDRLGPAAGSVLLGVLWAVWHLPLFLLAGTIQHRMGLGVFGFWAFAATIVGNAVLMTAIYNRTRRSVLSGIAYHWGFNFLSGALILTPIGRAVMGAVGLLVALGLAATHTIARRSRRTLALPTPDIRTGARRIAPKVNGI